MSDAEAFERCIAAGGVAVFPADTVYGLACDPGNREAVQRLYALKRRPLDKPSAVMFFDLELALGSLPELGERTRVAMGELLPGAVSLLVPNPEGRFALACGADPSTLGVRVPDVPPLREVGRVVLQSSANDAGGADPRRLTDVPESIQAGADLVIDGGELPGVPSTVVDLRRYEEEGSWSVVREGMVGEEELQRALAGQYHFSPENYEAMIRADVPAYDELQRVLVAASGAGARRILELGTGTGTTAQLLLARHPEAFLVGIDASEAMLAEARRRLPGERVELRVGRIEAELPAGRFEVVASALCVHHLDGGEKAELFRRARALLAPGGRFVLADLVLIADLIADGAEMDAEAEVEVARTPSTPGFDKPSSVRDQLRWLAEAGFEARVIWERGDLAVIVGEV